MDRVVFDVRRAGVCYVTRAAKLLGRWSFTHARVDVFVIHAQAIARFGVVFQCDIRARLGVSRSTMSMMMARLERHGFIERRRSEHDRRRVVVTITPLGQRTFAEVRAHLGPGLLTPHVDGHLLLHDYRTAIPVQRQRILTAIGVLRSQFQDFSRSPYPP